MTDIPALAFLRSRTQQPAAPRALQQPQEGWLDWVRHLRHATPRSMAEQDAYARSHAWAPHDPDGGAAQSGERVYRYALNPLHAFCLAGAAVTQSIYASVIALLVLAVTVIPAVAWLIT